MGAAKKTDAKAKKVDAKAKKGEVKYYKPMALDVTIQTERAYQRQRGINENSRKHAKKHRNAHGRLRYFKKIGLGYRTPKAASCGRYVDNKCPFTSDVHIRGRILRALVWRVGKMRNTIVCRRNYLHFVKKYQRYEKRHKNFTVHCTPAFDPKKGDDVVVGQCRPLSKTIRYNVIEHVPRSGKKQTELGGKKFAKH